MTSFGVFSYVHVRSYKQFDTFVDSVHYRYTVQLNLSLTVHACHYYMLYTTRYFRCTRLDNFPAKLPLHYGLHEHACMLMQSSRVLLVSFQACALACKIMHYWFYVYKQAFSLYACPFRRLRNMQSTTQTQHCMFPFRGIVHTFLLRSYY